MQELFMTNPNALTGDLNTGNPIMGDPAQNEAAAINELETELGLDPQEGADDLD